MDAKANLRQLYPNPNRPCCGGRIRNPVEAYPSPWSRIPLAVKDILWTLCLTAIPMIALNTVLLLLVFRNRITRSKSAFDALRPYDEVDEAGTLYVDINAPTLVFIASLSSSAALTLAGLTMSLVAYPLARRMRGDSSQKGKGCLPTPLELSRLVTLINSGGMGSLYKWLWKIKFLLWHSQNPIVRIAYGTFTFVAFLSIAISAADAWLHISTKTVPISKVDAIPLVADNITLAESISLEENCYDDGGNNTFLGQGMRGTSCVILAVAEDYHGTSSLGDAGIKILEDVHDYLTVYNFTSDRDFAYLGGSTFSRMFVYNRNKYDFISQTFAIETACQPITSSCNFFHNNRDGPVSYKNVSNVPFACNPQTALRGNLDVPRIALSFFTNSSATDANVNNTATNPFHFGIATLLPTTHRYKDDDPAYLEIGSHTAIVLSCHATAHNANFTFVNGSVRAFETQLSNVSVASMFMTPIAFTDIGHYKLYGAAQLAAVTSANSSEFARALAYSFSRVATALIGPGVVLSESPIAQMRTNLLAARVPMAPLFTLVAMNLGYALCAAGLATWALRAASTGAPWHVQIRLGIPALVAQMLGEEIQNEVVKDVEDLFEETEHVEGCTDVRRITLEKAEGRGWEIDNDKKP